MLWRNRESAVEKSLEAVENRCRAVEKWRASVENAVGIPWETDPALWTSCG